jgi:transcriptional regulator with XRE-family HTH domain
MINERDFYAAIGLALEAERKEQGLLRAQVARMAGVSNHTVTRAERGENIEVHTLYQICRALRADIYDMVENAAYIAVYCEPPRGG